MITSRLQEKMPHQCPLETMKTQGKLSKGSRSHDMLFLLFGKTAMSIHKIKSSVAKRKINTLLVLIKAVFSRFVVSRWKIFIHFNISEITTILKRAFTDGHREIQWSKIRFIRDTLNISTVKSHTTQWHVKIYHSMRHVSSTIFSVVRATTRICWHRSRILHIARPSDHLRHHVPFIMQRTIRYALQFLHGHEFMFSTSRF